MNTTLHASKADNDTLGPKSNHAWLWSIMAGSLIMLLGFAAVGHVVMASLISIVTLGMIVISVGIVEVIGSFGIKERPGVIIELLSGIVAVIFGIAIIRSPVTAASTISLLIGLYLIIEGVMKSVSSAYLHFRGRGALFASGLLNTILGVMVLIGWPTTSLWIIGLLLAVRFIVSGASLIGFGATIHQLESAHATR